MAQGLIYTRHISQHFSPHTLYIVVILTNSVENSRMGYVVCLIISLNCKRTTQEPHWKILFSLAIDPYWWSNNHLKKWIDDIKMLSPNQVVYCMLCAAVRVDEQLLPGCLLRVNRLLWRHNERHSVSNHQPHDYFLNHLFSRRSKKTSKLRVTGLREANSPLTAEFPAQRASNAENASIWWRHHDIEAETIWLTCDRQHSQIRSLELKSSHLASLVPEACCWGSTGE